MDNFDFDGTPENEWEDRGDLAWNEFDWERYLREQDDAVHRYLGFYEAFRLQPDRIDRVAEQMGWEPQEESEDAVESDQEADEDSAEFADEDDVYTLHKNPVFVATKAIYLSLQRPWELAATDPAKVPTSLAVPFLATLHRGEEYAALAIHALDFGDYAMAISLLKRALAALNQSLALMNSETARRHAGVRPFCERAMPRLFDLREIWLRVIAECRRELSRPIDDES